MYRAWKAGWVYGLFNHALNISNIRTGMKTIRRRSTRGRNKSRKKVEVGQRYLVPIRGITGAQHWRASRIRRCIVVMDFFLGYWPPELKHERKYYYRLLHPFPAPSKAS